MRTLFILSLTLLALSCNTSSESKQDGEGEIVSLNSQALSAEESNRLAKICNAIDYKTTLLDTEDRDFIFNYSQKLCEDEEVRTERVVAKVETMRSRGGEPVFTFERQDGNSYVFDEIETTDTGIVRNICAAIRSTVEPAKNPMLIGASAKKALWYYTASSSDCQPDGNHTCLFLVHGSSEDGVSFKRHTREILKVRVTNDVNLGYFVMRNRKTINGCSKGESVYKTVLK